MQDFAPAKDFKFLEFEGRPFQPFSRSERILKCCDFSKQSNIKEDDFETVGQKIVKKNVQKKITFYPQQTAQQNTSFRSQFDHSSQRRSKFSHASAKKNINFKKTKFKDSITIQPDWITITETQKQNIDKCAQSLVTSTVINEIGTIRRFNPQLEKVKPNYEKKIENACEDLHSSSTIDDEYLKGLIEQDVDPQMLTVYSTDKLLFAILTLKYSVYPWDIHVTKKGKKLIFDKSPSQMDKMTYLEIQTINENITVDMPEEERTVVAYCEESIGALANWQHLATLNTEIYSREQEDAKLFSEDFGYRYLDCRVCDRLDKGGRNEQPKIGQERIKLILRTQIDAVNSKDQPVLVKGLNECEYPANWRKQMVSQAGAITSTAQIYNTNNIAKWLCHAQIVESDEIKIGYLARQQPKDNSKHSLLLVESFNYKELASSINFKYGDCWQNFRYLVEFLEEQEDGNYVLLKQAYKQSIRIFKVNEEEEVQQEEQPQQ